MLLFSGIFYLWVAPGAVLAEFTSYSAGNTNMVLIPAGEFFMGSPVGDGGLPDEQPERRVYLNSFWIDRHEVTNGHYLDFVNVTGHRPPANSDPPRQCGRPMNLLPGIPTPGG